MLMVSLPNVGMMTRMACGSTMRRIVSDGDMPSDEAASVWPASTEMMPARTSSAAYAASFSPRARIADHEQVVHQGAGRGGANTMLVNGRPT